MNFPFSERVNFQTLDKKQELNYDLNPINLINSDGAVYSPKNPQNCDQLVKEGSNFDNKLYDKLRRPPMVNMIYFLIAFFATPVVLKRES